MWQNRNNPHTRSDVDTSDSVVKMNFTTESCGENRTGDVQRDLIFRQLAL